MRLKRKGLEYSYGKTSRPLRLPGKGDLIELAGDDIIGRNGDVEVGWVKILGRLLLSLVLGAWDLAYGLMKIRVKYVMFPSGWRWIDGVWGK